MKLYNGIELSALPGLAMVLIIFGLIVGIGTTMNQQMKTNTGIYKSTTKNSTMALQNGTATNFPEQWVTSITLVGNETPFNIGSGNYTLTTTEYKSYITLAEINATPYTFKTMDYTVAYVYNEKQGGYYALENSTLGQMTMVENQTLLGTIIGLGAVVTLLAGAFLVFGRPEM